MFKSLFCQRHPDMGQALPAAAWTPRKVERPLSHMADFRFGSLVASQMGRKKSPAPDPEPAEKKGSSGSNRPGANQGKVLLSRHWETTVSMTFDSATGTILALLNECRVWLPSMLENILKCLPNAAIGGPFRLMPSPEYTAPLQLIRQ